MKTVDGADREDRIERMRAWAAAGRCIWCGEKLRADGDTHAKCGKTPKDK